MPKIKDSFIQRFNNLSEKEIKEIDKELFSKILSDASNLLLNKYSQEEVSKIIESTELDLSLRFLKSPIFEKRIKGINEIKEILERIEFRETLTRMNENIVNFSFGSKTTKYITAEIFLKWISENEVMKSVLGDSMHVEIIKRSHDIIKFMLKKQHKTLELLAEIWKACEGKHDSIVKVIFDLIVEISDQLPAEGIQFILQKIKEIPIEQHNELTLELIKGFTENIARTLNSTIKYDQIQLENPQNDYLYGIKLLWDLMLDSSPLSNNLVENALNYLKSIISHSIGKNVGRNYLLLCCEQISEGKSVPQCLNLFHSVINNYYNTHFNLQQSLKKVMAEIDKAYDIIDIIIRDTERYCSLVKSKTSKMENPHEIGQIIFEGKYNHNININNRLGLLQYFIANTNIDNNITEENLETLWKIFIVNADSKNDNINFYKWLMKRNEVKPDLLTILNKELYEYLFFEILCNNKKCDYLNMTEESFECFKNFFKIINSNKNKIRIIRNNIIYTQDIKLEGMNSLWAIFLNSKNKIVIENSAKFLTDLHLNINLKKNRKEIIENFTKKCIDSLKDGYKFQNKKLISQTIFLLMILFDKFEGKNIIRNYEQKRSMMLQIKVIYKAENIQKEFRFDLANPVFINLLFY